MPKFISQDYKGKAVHEQNTSMRKHVEDLIREIRR